MNTDRVVALELTSEEADWLWSQVEHIERARGRWEARVAQEVRVRDQLVTKLMEARR